MNPKRAFTRWKMKLQKAEAALSKNSNNDNKCEVEWCLRHVVQYRAMMDIKSTDKRKLKGQHRSR